MTFLIFLIGVSVVLNITVGCIAWRATTRLDVTRCELHSLLEELERIRKLSRPIPQDNKPANFRSLVGNALVRYETKTALDRIVAEIAA